MAQDSADAPDSDDAPAAEEGAEAQEPVEVLPRPAVVKSASYRTEIKGEGEDQILIIKGSLEVEAFQEGWSVLPLGDAGLSITQTSFGDAELNYGPDGFEVVLPDAGEYELGFVAQAPVSKEGKIWQTTFDLIPGAVSKVEAVFPGQGWDFKWGRPVAFERFNEGPDTRLEFFFSGREKLALEWIQEEELKPIVNADTTMETFLSAGAVKTKAKIVCDIQRAPIEKLEILVPFPHQVTEVVSYAKAEPSWEMIPEGAARKLIIELGQEVRGGLTLELTLEGSVDELPASLDVKALQVVGANRQSGSLKVMTVPTLKVAVESADGLNAKPADQDKVDPNLVGDYRFLSTPFNLAMQLEAAEALMRAETETVLEVQPDLARLRTKFDYNIRRVRVQQLKVELPGGYREFDVTGPFVEKFSVAGDVLTVNFEKPMMGDLSFELRAVASRPTEESTVTAPAFTLQGVQQHNAELMLPARGNLEPSVERLGGMRKEDPKRLGFHQNSAFDLAFVYQNTAEPALVSFKKLQPKITAEVRSLVDLKDNAVKYQWWVDYEIREAATDELLLQVPAAISDRLRVEGVRYKEIVKGAKGKTETAGKIWWAIKLPEMVEGKFQVPLVLTLPEPGFSVDAKKEVNVPEILPQADEVYSQIAVLKSENLEVTQEVSKTLQQIPNTELSGPTQKVNPFEPYEPYLAFESYVPGNKLDFTVTKSQFVVIPHMIVTYADATSVVASDGGVKSEVIYWVNSTMKQDLRIKLPQNGKMISHAYVNGEELTPRQTEDEYLIPLPASPEDKSYPVRIAYEIPSATPGEGLPEWRTVIPMAELPEVEIVQSRLRLFLPDDYRYNRIQSAMIRNDEPTRWEDTRHYLLTLMPTIKSQMEAVEVIDWQTPPALDDGVQSSLVEEGVAVELRRLDAPSEVLIGYGRKAKANILDTVLGLLAFVVGAWLTRGSVWTKFLYFVFVGLMALFLASGSGSAHFAQVFGSIFVGVMAAALVWVLAGLWSLLQEPKPKKKPVRPESATGGYTSSQQILLSSDREPRDLDSMPRAKRQRTRKRHLVRKTFKRRSDRVLGGSSSLEEATA